MKILIVEDHEMISRFIESKLKKLNYEVAVAVNGLIAINLMDKQSFDVVITDINMPEIDGLSLIKHIRGVLKSNIPIIVLSGHSEDKEVIDAFALGADDFISKPISISQLITRIHKITKTSLSEKMDLNTNQTIINKHRVGIIIPCYNEEARLKLEDFSHFVEHNTSYQLCFVNDGSEDKTLEILRSFERSNERYISVLDMPTNQGKAEAVRQGFLYLLDKYSFDYIGFLDADLSTDFTDFQQLIDTISQEKHIAVVGSRIARIGANITRTSSRAIIGKSINYAIQRIVGMEFRDTQCGAKIFTAATAQQIMQKPFLSRWLFDVEIFIRLRKLYGANRAAELIDEMPLKRWMHQDGSKLSFMDSLKIFKELYSIYSYY